MATVAKGFTKNIEHRKRVDESVTSKSILLPQKKRVLPPNSAGGSPLKKNQKLSNDEGTADETLIRETEAALKNLSGSWTGTRTYNQEESPVFENLFDEKKSNAKLSPSSTSNSSTDNTCSLKDVITLRDQHEEITEEKSVNIKGRQIKIKQEEGEKRPRGSSQYHPPDFNELVDDDTSNELEIDMSESAAEKNEKLEKDKKEPDNTKPAKYPTDSAFHSSPFSTSSAFRPPQSTKNTLTNLGPYPAEATFVGYPSAIGISDAAATVDDKKNILQLKPPAEIPPETAAVKSPETSSKQYTILQPATVGSRAANALQEVAREGVPVVSAVSGAPAAGEPTKMVPVTTVAGALSPNSIGRGEWRRFPAIPALGARMRVSFVGRTFLAVLSGI